MQEPEKPETLFYNRLFRYPFVRVNSCVAWEASLNTKVNLRPKESRGEPAAQEPAPPPTVVAAFESIFYYKRTLHNLISIIKDHET